MSAISFKILAAVSWVFTGVAILLTAGRYWIRCKIIKRLSWDDAAHLLALLLLVAQISIVSGAASMIYQIANYETGDDEHYQAKHSLFVRLNIAGILITWCCLYAVKISFLLLYHRIFRISEKFIQAWWMVLGIVVLTFWILVGGSLTECGSPSALERVENCLAPSMMRRQKVFVIYSCALNVFSDLGIMALPLAMLKDLQMRTPAKVGLAGVFCCAFITVAFDILRAVETDMKGGVEGSTALWTNLESAIAVIVSCLPSFIALFSTKNDRKTGRNVSPYKQRSLVITDSAKLIVSAGSSVKTVKNGHSSAAGTSEKDIASSRSSMQEPATNTPKSQETPGIKSTNLKACKDALAVLVRTPEFTTPFRFSRNPRAMAKVIPAGWQMGDESDCRIIINCQNDHDSAIFRYADIAQIAKRIIENCVDHPDPFGRYPLLKWGGVDGIKEAETFYVGVARPIRPALEVEVGNMTVVASGGLIGGIVESS
ncbi:MAG: hypothetical protein ALECFALPRED_004773 [Alectoria fallacina]|uniref:Rhodopsin domain-containing protein n=1 Tax=Alectoria fallacina TaxID=1903189 RepID=A0A8H3IRV6_9LECA|nr:MAG: hypothetical protein ALECFALPRED_004773 [Alectoria fallacina]